MNHRGAAANRSGDGSNDLERDALALQRAMTDLVRVYQFRDRDAICGHGVTPAQSHALERLAVKGPMTLNEFAASLYLEKSSASRLVSGLEVKGLVSRRTHADDGRCVQIEVTRRGRSRLTAIERALLRERRQVLDGLAPHERAVVVAAVTRLAHLAALGVRAEGGACARVVTPAQRSDFAV